MNIKRIWILAIIFGMLMSIFFYLMTTNRNKENVAVATSKVVQEEVQKQNTEAAAKLHSTELRIEPGKRAISLAVNEVQGVSGFLSPGNYVDVIAVLPLPVNETTTSQFLLENIKVLAVGKTSIEQESKTEEPYQTVTLEVSPEEGAELAFAKELGAITLMLRGNDDHKLTKNENISFQEIIEGKIIR